MEDSSPVVKEGPVIHHARKKKWQNEAIQGEKVILSVHPFVLCVYDAALVDAGGIIFQGAP